MTGADRPALAAYRAEVLRWNRRINLVSRQDTAARLDGLLQQCGAAHEALTAAEPDLAVGRVLYCDLGSGGGLPGVVWHLRLRATTAALESWLVEPREKRAWFLQRVARVLGPDAFAVAAARWDEIAARSAFRADAALVSLKALRLTDAEVLAGLTTLREGAGTPPARVVIVRFHPAGAAWTPALAAELGTAAVGERHGRWVGAGAGIVAVPDGEYPPVSLVVARYSCAES